jgi:hypothetical protein
MKHYQMLKKKFFHFQKFAEIFHFDRIENVSINVSPKENENLNFKNNTCTIKQETSREITDDLFSQVSPTVMEEMCSVGSDQKDL